MVPLTRNFNTWDVEIGKTDSLEFMQMLKNEAIL